MFAPGSVGVRLAAVFLSLWVTAAACAQDDLPSGVDAVPETPPAVADAPAGDAAAKAPQSAFPTYLLIACGLLWFYLLIIRPGSRQKAERASMMERLKTNTEVVTIGGIHGTVTKRPQRTTR